jgi:hypothetical protein
MTGPRLVDRKTYLLRRFRLGQRARLRNRRLSSGFRRCVCRANANDNHQHSDASPTAGIIFFTSFISSLGNLTCKPIDRSLESTQFAGSLPFQILYPKVLFLLFNRDP